MAAVFYIYILYSPGSKRYYVGHTSDPARRLLEHNTTDKMKYTSKYRPWEMQLFFEVSEIRGEAIKIEKFIKRQKSRQFLSELITKGSDPGYIGRLLRYVLG